MVISFLTSTITVLSFTSYFASTNSLSAPVTFTLHPACLCFILIVTSPFGYNPLKLKSPEGTPVSSIVIIISLFGSVTFSTPISISPFESVVFIITLLLLSSTAFVNVILNVIPGIFSPGINFN